MLSFDRLRPFSAENVFFFVMFAHRPVWKLLPLNVSHQPVYNEHLS